MQTRLMKTAPARLAAAVLVLGVATTAAYADMEPMAPMTPPAATTSTPAPAAKAPTTTPRSNAQLEQEIKSLRAQVQQLQQAQGMPMSKPPGKGMSNMPKDGGATPPADPPMKKGCMGMGCMEKGDDAMKMPPPAVDPKPMPDQPMSDM
ncbi:MAG: hypothetical protein JWQ90_4619 [Hydrocarboniphaga sp.]|uniref:hypothetical protein n=1 Tax=Hydrocarboniphaga sp. TaxID=2033016 RepID=UPI0026092E3A|nr:hypothetical protein [Hydrocarboniphaga sp.]MDB5972169.1 hypothetical protein [Hydrocarboniphaga sp.]